MNKLSSNHFMLLILSVTMIALRSYSSIFIELGGRDTWILAILASVIIGLFVLFLLKICISTDTYDINVIFQAYLPKFISKIFLLLFAIGLFLMALESATVNASSIHTNFFISSPVWYCLLFFLIPSSYVVCRNFNTLLIVVITTVCLILIGDIIYLILVMKHLDLDFLLPILKSGMTKKLWLCLFSLIGSLSSVMIVFPFLKYIKNDNKLLTKSTLAFIIICFFITTSFVSIISFLGPERASSIFFPEYIQSQRVQISDFFEFGEIFYICRNSLMWFTKYILCSSGIILLYGNKIKNKKKFIILYTLIIFILSTYFTQNQYYLFYNLKILQIIILIPFVLIPFISFLCSKVKYIKNSNS